ncbi:gliding motility-associated C-terminal domain-containing protein [Spirosoma rigui]|uniref:gliding motility-associated C-terminal domain-containing protein n=1 Tax=Spirosoma rigui TaxID=564064 RepID=UPI0009B02A93|nr:gliding motility-associated C-terminal domain-containing protein [Spirosoma rigui]
MKKWLYRGFVGIGSSVLLTLLVPVTIVAGTQMPTDSCQHPEAPVITGSAKTVCRSETVVLTATGCTGTVVWSTGETGSQITVGPQQTTTYTAICRAHQGCISCFADGWKITVATPVAPILTVSTALVCAGDPVTLTADNCAGTVRWLDLADASGPTPGLSRTVRPRQTTAYRAICETKTCVSNPSTVQVVQVAAPDKPVISVDKNEICLGQAVHLTASNCLGVVRWSDGGTGLTRTVAPEQTTSYRASCQIGTCQSDSSVAVLVAVRSAAETEPLTKTITNGCPFQTADLSASIAGIPAFSAGLQVVFRTQPTPNSPAVQSPGAVTAGTYYVLGRTAEGCYTEPITVAVAITACQQAVAACLSNPATLVTRLDSLDWTKGVVRLQGELGGSARAAAWQSTGDGIFTDAGLNARYVLSEGDRRRGAATFTLTAPDPDGSGPCVGAVSHVVVTAPLAGGEMIGLSKRADEPIVVTEAGKQLVELTYQMTISNMGKNGLTQVQISDNLAAAFPSTGVQLRSVAVRADSGLVINASYTGRGRDTTLIVGGRLPVGGSKNIWLTVRLDVSQSLTSLNRATAEAIDSNGLRVRDVSTAGTSADPDKNGNPGDNSEPTAVTLNAIPQVPGPGPGPGTTDTVFIPEGFSPNGDGINDRFVIQRLPVGVTVQLEILNRWGHIVYRNDDYKNDWDGTANQGTTVGGNGAILPEGTYYYQVRLSDGSTFSRFLTLVR